MKLFSLRQFLVDWLLFDPFLYPEGEWEPEGLLVEDCYFQAGDGTRLHAWYCPIENSAQTVFYAHGNRGNLATRTTLLRRLQALLRCNIYIFDYRGYGRSQGRPSLTTLLEDSHSALDDLCRRTSAQPADLLMIGRSLGGSVVSQLATARGARALIVECTFSSLQEAAAARYPRWLARLLAGSWLNTIDLIDQYRGPLIVGHGETDSLIPISHSESIFERANSPKHFFRFPDQGHKVHAPDWFWEEVRQIVDGIDSHTVSSSADSIPSES